MTALRQIVAAQLIEVSKAVEAAKTHRGFAAFAARGLFTSPVVSVETSDADLLDLRHTLAVSAHALITAAWAVNDALGINALNGRGISDDADVMAAGQIGPILFEIGNGLRAAADMIPPEARFLAETEEMVADGEITLRRVNVQSMLDACRLLAN